eukprot:8234682-Lingulodinium_polyedra.AAC.1
MHDFGVPAPQGAATAQRSGQQAAGMAGGGAPPAANAATAPQEAAQQGLPQGWLLHGATSA